MNSRAAIANSLWVTSAVPAWCRFQTALGDPAAAQLSWLRRHLKRNAGSAFGHAHKLESVRSLSEFVRRVPLRDYPQTEPWIHRIRQGESRVLTVGPVTHLIPTGGSTGAQKLIPFTAELQRDFDQAIGPWIADLARQRPGILGGLAYWSITPPPQSSKAESSAVPVGFAEDAAYLGGIKSLLVKAALARPRLHPGDALETIQFETLLCLLRARELRLISVWHPSFLTLLLDALPRLWPRLLARLPRMGPWQHLDPCRPEMVWPQLRVVSCWGDAHARQALADLQRRLPGVFIQPKGLLATEAFVTIPFGGQHPVALRSHFFEFLDETGRLRRLHELRDGETYEVVVTTGGGLWRYQLGDLVQVSGRVKATPSLRFLGRKGGVSDHFGEKLTEALVANAVHQACAQSGAQLRFSLLAFEPAPSPRYCLFHEGGSLALATHIEALLRRNPQYDLCRRLGQLHPVEACEVKHGHATFMAYEMSKGRRQGDIKPSSLSPETGWRERFNQNHSMHRSTPGSNLRPPVVACGARED